MRRILLAAGAAATALSLAACGADTTGNDMTGHDMTGHGGMTATTTAAPAADHVNADVNFLQEMIPHHQGAVQMADLAVTRAQSPQVKQLAAQIKAAQGPEITQMAGWLKQWNQPEMPMAAGHAMSQMPGMSADDTTKLTAARGSAFDRMFLTMMIGHHQGAIDMAKQEQTDGRFQPAKDLAASISTSQQAQIDQMQTMLKAV